MQFLTGGSRGKFRHIFLDPSKKEYEFEDIDVERSSIMNNNNLLTISNIHFAFPK